MSKLDTTAWLASVLGHLNRHPNLNFSVTAVLGYERCITVGYTDDLTSLTVFARWARSLTGVAAVLVTSIDVYTHIRVTGALEDGTEVKVTVLLEDAESDLLAANTVVEEGATFAVELLYQLTSSVDAERRLVEAVTQ